MKTTLALLAVALSLPAIAQDKIPCSSEQGLGFLFGKPVRSSPVKIAAERKTYIGALVATLDAQRHPWPPFTEMEAQQTLKSGVVWSVDGVRRYDTAEDAKASYEALLASYATQSRTPWKISKTFEKYGGNPEYSMPMEKTVIVLTLADREISVKCERYEYAMKALREAVEP